MFHVKHLSVLGSNMVTWRKSPLFSCVNLAFFSISFIWPKAFRSVFKINLIAYVIYLVFLSDGFFLLEGYSFNQLFGLLYIQAVVYDLFCNLLPVLIVCKFEKRSCMAFSKPAGDDFFLDVSWQRQDPYLVRYGRLVLC